MSGTTQIEKAQDGCRHLLNTLPKEGVPLRIVNWALRNPCPHPDKIPDHDKLVVIQALEAVREMEDLLREEGVPRTLFRRTAREMTTVGAAPPTNIARPGPIVRVTSMLGAPITHPDSLSPKDYWWGGLLTGVTAFAMIAATSFFLSQWLI